MLWRLKSALPHHGLYEFGSVEIYLNCFSTDPKKAFPHISSFKRFIHAFMPLRLLSEKMCTFVHVTEVLW